MWKILSEKLKIDEEIPRVIEEVFKFDKITKVQNIVINEFLKNKDVIVKSATGSGKTLSYIIPIIQRLINYSKENQNYQKEILALILLPARELAEQVYSEFSKFISNMKNYSFTAQILIGGKKLEDDIAKIRNQIPNIIIATPGRLVDIQEKEKLSFSNLEILILDEADRMLDMGFEMAVTSIISKLPKQRRTGLFSATVTSNVENLIKAGMRNPEFINIIINQNKSSNLFVTEKEIKEKINNKGSYFSIIEFSPDNYRINNSSQEVPKGLGQYYRVIKNIKFKIPHLMQLLYGFYNSDKNEKIMIFLSTCFSVDYYNILLPELFKKFNITNYSCSKLHSKISQNKREKEYKNFKIEDTHKLNILLTTDLAARGIDIPDVDIIIQFDPPKNEDSYIHKAGRTARVGNTGVSILFLLEEELSFINYMKQKFIFIEEFPYPYIDNENKNEEEVDNLNKQSILQCVKEINISDKWIYDKAVNTFISYLRFYKENELKYIFDIRSLDIGNLANSFQLLKLPRLKIKEFQNETIKNFVGDSNIEPSQLVYLDKNIRKQMEMKKEKINEKLEEIRERKKIKKEIIKLNGRNNGDKLNRTRKERKEVKIKNIMEQWDDLADDDLLYKKYKKGKISKEEYEKHLLNIK